MEATLKPSENKKEVIVISGSSGFIGTALIHRMASQYRIAGLDNTGYPFPPAEAECICLDITSGKIVEFAIITGAALIALSFPRGRIREKYGTFDKYIF